MKYIQRIAIGVGVGSDVAVYADASNKHLLLGNLPRPKSLKKYRKSWGDALKFYFIDKGVVVFYNERKEMWYSVDLKTGRVRKLLGTYILAFESPEELPWVSKDGETLIVYLAKFYGDNYRTYLYSRNISSGIQILEEHLRRIEKLFKILKSGPERISVGTYYGDPGDNIYMSFLKPFLIKTPLGNYKVTGIKIRSKPLESFKLILDVETTSSTQPDFSQIYPGNVVSLEEFAKIITN